MNDRKNSSLIIYDLEGNNGKKDESLEDYQIIKEDYCSSPKCGIRSKIVTKSTEKIIFSPIEISTNPYFKYSVIPVKEEFLKCDFSQSETNHTRIQEEIKSKKNINNISNNPKISYIEIIKDELKEEKNENESENEEKKMNKGNSSQISDNKKNGIINNDSILQEKSVIIQNRKINAYKISPFNINNIHHSINLKDKIKLSLNENIKEQKKTKISQKIMHSLLILNNENNQNHKISETDMINLKYNIDNSRKKITNSLLNSLKLKKEIRPITKNNSPFTITKDRKDPIKVKSSLTSTNIKRIIKKQKRSQENGLKKLKTTYDIHLDQNINNINKSKREKNKNKTLNKEKCNNNTGENKKEENMDNKNNNKEDYFINRPIKKKSKHKKIKSFAERVIANLNKESSRHNEIDDKNKNKEKEKDDSNDDNFLKRRTNNFVYYKLNIDDSLKKQKNIFEMPNTAKRRRRSIFDFNLDDNKKKNILINLRKEKESKESLTSKKKSAFSNKVFIDKEKKKEKSKDKNKENENLLKNKNTKEKKDRKKNKKKERNKTKEKDKYKDLIKANKEKEKKKDANLKLINKNSKENNKFNKNNNYQINKEILRKPKSRTILYHNNNKSIFNRDSAKKLSLFPSYSESTKSNIKNVLSLKGNESREFSLKNNYPTNRDSSKKFIRCSRRHSTRILFHNKSSQNEKINEYTNKQTIDNINEYTKQCLEIIPDLYELEEMPRCKNKIRIDFLKKNLNSKKVALFDLDETIVHCIGEINMNNVENFSRQSDAKIKVQLPGGKKITIGINIRPHWEKALDILKDKYHIIAYTASHESYADSVLNYLDPEKKYFEYRLYRCHCVLCNIYEMKFYIKDLSILEECCDLKDIVLIDNSVLSFAYHLDNGIPISPFYDSKNDCELLDISNFLLKYADENDIRNKLREVYKLNEYLEIIKNLTSEDSFSDNSSISVVQEDEEGEKTNKNFINQNNSNKFNLVLNSNKSSKNNIIHENKEDNSDDNENINTSILKDKTKNSSQHNLKFKEIIEFFDREEHNIKKSKSFSYKEKKRRKFDSKRIIDYSNISKNIDKSWCLVKRKNKFKSFRNLDINFKKEWDEKQKELNNNK